MTQGFAAGIIDGHVPQREFGFDPLAQGTVWCDDSGRPGACHRMVAQAERNGPGFFVAVMGFNQGNTLQHVGNGSRFFGNDIAPCVGNG